MVEKAVVQVLAGSGNISFCVDLVEEFLTISTYPDVLLCMVQVI